MRLKVYYWDESTDEADVGAAAQIALEEEFDILFTDAFDTGKGKAATKGRLKYLYFLTWAALRASGREVADDWREWAKGVKDAGFALGQDGDVEPTKANPTKRGRSRAASSS